MTIEKQVYCFGFGLVMGIYSGFVLGACFAMVVCSLTEWGKRKIENLLTRFVRKGLI